MLPLGFHQNRVAGFPRPTCKKLAASRRRVVSRSLPATLDRYPHGSAGHVAIPNRSIRACEPLALSGASSDRVKLRDAAFGRDA